MKVFFFIVLAFFLTVFWGCNKKKYPDSIIDAQSVFYFKALVNNTPVSFGAGVNNYFMYSSFNQDSNSVYNFTGTLKQTTCAGACANSVRIQINDYKVSPANAPVKNDSSFISKTYPFSTYMNTPYDVTFQSSYNKPAASYAWDFGDGDTSTSPNPTHRYVHNGTYNVCLTVNGINSCVSTVCNSHKIGLPGIHCQTAISAGSSLGKTISFSQTSTGFGSFSYLWDFGDGGRSTAPNPTHTYAVSGSYPVSLRVIDFNNDESTATYNAVTQLDGSSCAANYKVTNIVPLTLSQLNLSTVGLTWTDANGIAYTSQNIQPASSYFQILSVEDYPVNENGQKTKKVHVKFKCDVVNGNTTLTIDNAEAVICVAYQ